VFQAYWYLFYTTLWFTGTKSHNATAAATNSGARRHLQTGFHDRAATNVGLLPATPATAAADDDADDVIDTHNGHASTTTTADGHVPERILDGPPEFDAVRETLGFECETLKIEAGY